MPPYFDHEKLLVYQEALRFVRWLEPILTKLPRKLAVHDQLDRSSTSIPMNIAEGNGKFTSPDRCRFFDIARGSALECASGLDVLVAKGQLTEQEVCEGKETLHGVVSKLVGLIRSNSTDRLYEAPGEYRTAVEIKTGEQGD
jgi:four helix bundle protein